MIHWNGVIALRPARRIRELRLRNGELVGREIAGSPDVEDRMSWTFIPSRRSARGLAISRR